MKRRTMGLLTALTLITSAAISTVPAAAAVPQPGEFSITGLNGPRTVTLGESDKQFPLELTFVGTPLDRDNWWHIPDWGDDRNGDGAYVDYRLRGYSSRADDSRFPHDEHFGADPTLVTPWLSFNTSSNLTTYSASVTLNVPSEATPGKYDFLVALGQVYYNEEYSSRGIYSDSEFSFSITVIAPSKVLKRGVFDKSVTRGKKRTRVQFDVERDALINVKSTLYKAKRGTKKWKKVKTSKIRKYELYSDKNYQARFNVKGIKKSDKLRVVVHKTAYTQSFKFPIK